MEAAIRGMNIRLVQPSQRSQALASTLCCREVRHGDSGDVEDHASTG